MQPSTAVQETGSPLMRGADGMIDVRDYGAKGDGVTDDTAAIQAAFDAGGIEYNRGKIVFIPAGTYKVTQLDFRSSLTVQGAGQYTTILQGSGVGASVLRFVDVGRGALYNLNVDGNNVKATAAEWRVSANPNSCGSHVIDQVSFVGGTRYIVRIGNPEGDGVDQIAFHRCTFYGSPSVAGVYITNPNTTEIRFESCSLILTGSPYCVQCGGGGMTSFDNCFFHGATDWSIYNDCGWVRVYNSSFEGSCGAFKDVNKYYMNLQGYLPTNWAGGDGVAGCVNKFGNCRFSGAGTRGMQVDLQSPFITSFDGCWFNGDANSCDVEGRRGHGTLKDCTFLSGSATGTWLSQINTSGTGYVEARRVLVRGAGPAIIELTDTGAAGLPAGGSRWSIEAACARDMSGISTFAIRDIGSGRMPFGIDSAGHVGLGAISPTHALNVVGDVNNTGRLIASVHTLAANDTTPSVAAGRLFKTANSSPTRITMFDDGEAGQVIQVCLDGNTIVDFTGTHLKGNNGTDFRDPAGGLLTAWFDETDWYCMVQGF